MCPLVGIGLILLSFLDECQGKETFRVIRSAIVKYRCVSKWEHWSNAVNKQPFLTCHRLCVTKNSKSTHGTARNWRLRKRSNFLTFFEEWERARAGIEHTAAAPCKPDRPGTSMNDCSPLFSLAGAWKLSLVLGFFSNKNGIVLMFWLRGEKVYWSTRTNCRRAEKYGDIRWKGQCPFALQQHTERVLEWFLPNVSSWIALLQWWWLPPLNKSNPAWKVWKKPFQNFFSVLL